MSRPDRRLTREWVRSGTEFFVQQLDTDLSRPSLLPGWTRAHVAGHVARNAEALARLARWARTGVETHMYASPEQRQEEIEESSRLPQSVLRADVRTTAAGLDEALDALDAVAWEAEVRSARGRLIPATEIPWLRVREVWLHAVDLDAGTEVGDLPPDLVDCLLDDVTAGLAGRAPALLLRPVDRGRTWQVPGLDELTVAGPTASLLAWLTGRGDGKELDSDRELPELPTWL